MVHKERCVCEICTCGKHHCAKEQKFKSTGQLTLENQGDIYIAAKTAYSFPDSLNLFHGDQDLNTIAKDDYKGHTKVGVERMKPTDQIELGQGKMEDLTVNTIEFPGHDVTVAAADVKTTAAARGATQVDFGKEDRVNASVYGADFQTSQQKVRKSKRRGTAVDFGSDVNHATSYNAEFAGNKGSAQATFNFPDSLNLFYGAQDLNTIVNDDYKGHTKVGVERMKPTDQIELGQGKMEDVTWNASEFPGYDIQVSAGDVKKTAAARDATQVDFGKEDRVNASVYGADFKKSQPKVRKSKRRGTAVDFGSDVNHATSYNAEFAGVGGGKQKTCEFNDSLNLFHGGQDHQTIAKGDFTGHSINAGIEKHRPKDTFEMAHADLTTESDLEIKIQAGSHGSSKAAPKPSKAAKEPKVEADAKAKLAAKLEVDAKAKPAAKLEAAANLETGRTSFNLANAMPKTKMQNDTSYNNHYTAKEGSKVNKFHYKDEIERSSGDIDLGTIQRSDYAKFDYGRPTINKIKDHNIMGVNYELGSGGGGPTMKEEDVSAYGMGGISVSRGSVGVVEAPLDVKVVSRESTKDSGISVGRATKTRIIRDKNGGSEGFRLNGAVDHGTTYGLDFKKVDSSVKVRTSKRKGSTINFGAEANYGTSYGEDFKLKQCLVPSLGELDEYTFKTIQSGHKVYDINCGCPPRGACGCTPPPE